MASLGGSSEPPLMFIGFFFPKLGSNKGQSVVLEKVATFSQ